MNTQFTLNGLTSANFFQFNEWTDINCPSHCHRTFETVFVKSGNITVEKGDSIYTLSKNDAIAIMPFEKHKFVTESASRIAVFEISTELISNFDSLFKNKTLKQPMCRMSDRDIENVYDHLKYAYNNPVEMNCIFFGLMSVFLRSSELVTFHAPSDIFQKAILYANSHYDEDICLKDVAKALNVSPVYLSRMFAKKGQIKFSEFINSFRLQKAIAMITDQSLPISEIAYACGFGSIRNFNRVFLKMMRCTPGEYRQKSIMANKTNTFHFYD